MLYQGTRGFLDATNFSDAILAGLSPDGGLFLPTSWPVLSADEMSALIKQPYADLAHALLTRFGADVLGDAALKTAANRTADAFLQDGKVPLRQLEDDLWLLELFHGPTFAFKDMAMQLMASLTDAALKARGERLLLVTATSGDTGAAAVRAFAGAERIDLVVLHPHERVSPVQRLQMTTVRAENVRNLAVQGDFDDCQRLVKALLADDTVRGATKISSVNSINWGRLLGQVPYYLAASAASGTQDPTFVVPTGNFGDAYAGIIARHLGGPVGQIHAAVNQNDALYRLLHEGVYRRSTARASHSVSMDVQAPSNLERLIFEVFDRDTDRTRAFFETFATAGEVRLDSEALNRLKAAVSADHVSEAETLAQIKTTYDRNGVVVCPHTAVALHATRKLSGPRIILSTAHAAKFPDSVEQALGFAPEAPDAIRALSGQKEVFTVVEDSLDAVRAEVLGLVKQGV